MNGIDELADFIVRQRIGDIGAPTLANLRLHVADTVCALIAAAQTAEGNALISFRRRATDGAVENNVALYCALARLSEIDDIHLASMTTPGSIAIPAAMTMATALPDVDIGDVSIAMLAGYEAMVRLGRAIKGPSILYRGIWPTYFGAGFATAAVAARLLRLDRTQTAHALAMALTMAAPSVGQHHAVTTARWFSVGQAARNGLTAAFAAQAGFTADIDVMKSRLLPDVYGIEPDLGVMSGDAGVAFALERVSFKPWCAARQTMAATQALRDILDGGVAAADISGIAAYVQPAHLKMIDHGITPGNRASFLTSLPYQLARMALQPEQMLDLDEPAAAALPALKSLMSRVTVAADENLAADYPSAWPARVVVTTPTGRHEQTVRDIPGDPGRPFGEREISDKAHRCIARTLGEARAEHLLQSSLIALQSPDTLSVLMQDLERVLSDAVA
jgi:2-methylcitrate dehydratase PrpD